MSDSTTVRISFSVDALDYKAICKAIAKRQSMRLNGECVMPDGEGDLQGRLIAEICRGWMEFMNFTDTPGL